MLPGVPSIGDRLASVVVGVVVSVACLAGAPASAESVQEAEPPKVVDQGKGVDAPSPLSDEIESVNKAIAEAKAEKSPNDAKIESLQQRLRDLSDTLAAQKRVMGYQDKTRAIVESRARAKALLEESTKPYVNPDIPSDLDDEAFATGVDAAQAASRVASQALSEVNEEQARRRDRRVQIPKLISEAEAGLLSLESRSDLTPFEQIQRRKYRAQIEALEAEERFYTDSDDVLRIERRARIQILARVDRTMEAWMARVSKRRILDAEVTRAEAAAVAEALVSPIARAEARENERMAMSLAAVVAKRDSLLAELDRQQGLLNRLKARVENDDAKFRGRVTPEVAELLRKRLSDFPDEQELMRRVRELRVMRSDLDLDRVLLLDGLDALADPNRFAVSVAMAAGLDGPQAEPVVEELVRVYEARLDQFGQPLLAAVNEELQTLATLIDVDLALATLSKRYRELVLRETLWIRDVRAFKPGFLGRTITETGELFRPSRWLGLLEAFGDAAVQRPLALLFGVSFPLAMLALRQRIAARIVLSGVRVTRPSTDHFRETIVCLLLAFLHGATLAVPVLVFGSLLADVRIGNDFATIVGRNSEMAAWYLLWLGTIYSIVRPEGLAERHFRWPQTTRRAIRAAMIPLLVTVPIGFMDRMCNAGALDLPDAGRLFYGVLPLCFIVTGYILLNPVKGLFASTIVDQPDSRVAQAPWLPLLIVTGILITVGILSVAGWYATILLLQRVLILSIMFIAVLMIARELLLRLLTCRQRVQVLALRRQEAEGEDITEQEVNLETLSGQTQGAIGFTVFVLLATGLWFLWSPVLPALQFGDGIVLWSRAIESLVANEDGALVQTTIAQPITLRDVGAAVFTIGFAMYAARHIPYLLGLLLLDRFRVGVGNRYAAVQIVRWAIGFGGLAAGVAMLGVTWDSVQWLAAGFTVGLGFGLQEIFANFISGIIILFEQPVRVGDMVTVGGTTGRITTVRMRSTAITDWDNKVLMVPNKMLITQEVINWSQGETSIRVVLAVGVSYGEDPEKVAAILLDAGRAAPHVLEEPEPTVNFNGFGESSMNFELRVFIPTTDRLVETRTWINTDVKRRFDEAGVTIPFPQRDIRVTMIGGAAIEPAAKRDDGDRTESPPGAEA